MIQRIQSLWLLLASGAALVSIKMPFYSGIIEAQTILTTLTGQTTFLILVLSVITGITALVSIFLFKNRKLQLKTGMGALTASFITIILYFIEAKKFSDGNYAISMLVILAVPVLLLMALRGIYKDEKLVKSLDRLRP